MRQLKIIKQVTNRNEESLDRYLQEIKKIDLITAKEETELAQKIKEGCEESVKKLVNANLRFVVSVAKQYQNQGLSLPDLISEGNIGLIKATKHFDETRGFKFISYAVWWIRQAILQALAEKSRVVRIPLNKIGSINKINKMYAFLEQENERPPSHEEIAKKIDMTVNEVRESIRISGRSISIDAPLVAEETPGLVDLLTCKDTKDPDSFLIDKDLSIELNRALKTLTWREQDTIKLFFGLDGNSAMTLSEIGEEYSLTRERVRQIKERGIRRLKHFSRSKILRKYLG